LIKESPYKILGLKGDFEFKDIKKAYRKAIRANPPEQNPKEFAKISDAYDVLTNEEYFAKNSQDVYSLDVELKIDEITVENSKHLKKIFEVPFSI
jgi:curved DNA-binding protein CbpA